jgi:hypothetical protein
MKNEVWLRITDFTGNHDDYSVSDWRVAVQEVIDENISFFKEEDYKSINFLILTNKWHDAIKLYNEKHMCNGYIERLNNV